MYLSATKQNRFFGFFSWGFFFSTGFICCGNDCVDECGASPSI